jgi:predicted nucleic acid-binding protein
MMSGGSSAATATAIADVHHGAAALHREARGKGLTIPTVDALIVEMARAAGLPLLTADAHQRRLAPLADVELS